jgi:hypothetical protein
MNITSARNPRYASADGSLIDVLATVETGEEWPFTAKANEPGTSGAIYVRAAAGEFGTIAPHIPPPSPVPRSITRRQCSLQLNASGFISLSEAHAMAKSAEPPAFIEAVFEQLSSDDRLRAEIDFAANTYERSNPLLIGIMTATGATSAEIDDFFRAAVLL